MEKIRWMFNLLFGLFALGLLLADMFGWIDFNTLRWIGIIGVAVFLIVHLILMYGFSSYGGKFKQRYPDAHK